MQSYFEERNELQDSWDQCGTVLETVLEAQMASMKKQLASMEHELKDTKQQLREKVLSLLPFVTGKIIWVFFFRFSLI